jgi:single-strand DNA-binding protein
MEGDEPVANLNKLMLIGRLTRDPEIVTFRNGGKVAKFGFAVNNRRKNQNGEWEDEPVFLDCEAYNRGDQGTQADRVADTLRKGAQVFIEGHLKLDQWEKDGVKQSKLRVVVDQFQYLDPRQGGDGQPSRQAAPARRPPPRSGHPSSRPQRHAGPAPARRRGRLRGRFRTARPAATARATRTKFHFEIP